LSEDEKKSRYDKDFIELVGIYYETHDYSAAEVAKHFDIKPKTVESWITRKGWIKGRLRGRYAELSKNFDKEKYARAISQMSEGTALDEAMAMADNDPKRAQAIVNQLTTDMVTSAVLDEELKWTVIKAKALVSGEKVSLNHLAQYQGMVINAKNAIYGKNPDMALFVNIGDLTPEQLGTMNTAQLARTKAKIEEEIRAMEAKDTLTYEGMVINGEQ